MVSFKAVLPSFPQFTKRFTAVKMSKYGIISGSYFPVFSPNTGKHGTEITPYLDTFHAAILKFLNVSLAGLLSFFQKLFFEIVPNSL